MINKKNALLVLAVVAVIVPPTMASAAVIVNTGTPTGTGAPAILFSAQSLAAEFHVSAGETIGTISAYLTQGTAQPGDTFVFDIYQTLPTSSNRNPPVLYTLTEKWEQNGWTTAAANWTPTTTGDYWLVPKQPVSGRGSWQFDAPPLASSSTGNPPALGFEFAGSSGFFSTSNAPTFGLEIDSAAPEPSTLAMALVWPAFLAYARRRRKAGEAVAKVIA